MYVQKTLPPLKTHKRVGERLKGTDRTLQLNAYDSGGSEMKDIPRFSSLNRSTLRV